MEPSDDHTCCVDPRLWTVADVAAYLGVAVKTVRDFTATGRLPCLKVGSLARYRPSEIREWAASRSGMRQVPRTTATP